MSLIRNSSKVVQAIDFTGVENGKIHPSDIDAVFEFDNKALILMEVKYVGTKIPTGQRMLLERICDSWHTKMSVVLKVEHDYNGQGDIPLLACYVSEMYYDGAWKQIKTRDLKTILNQIGVKWNINKCKF